MMSDTISILGLEVFAHHGVYPEENKLGQKFVLSVQLRTDTRKAGLTDQLDNSVDYGAVSHFIQSFVSGNRFQVIEAVAEQLAEALLLQYPLVRAVTVEVKKPWAPILLPLDAVAVEITRGWHRAYIALGSNMGDKKAFLDGAVQALRADVRCRVGRVSSYLETEPYGYTDQDTFLNACLELDTLYQPMELMGLLSCIEQDAKRERSIHWGPRTLDLDLLFYDDLVLDSENLTIPHKEMHKRSFVLDPLCEIAPYLRHPVYNRTIIEMKETLK